MVLTADQYLPDVIMPRADGEIYADDIFTPLSRPYPEAAAALLDEIDRPRRVRQAGQPLIIDDATLMQRPNPRQLIDDVLIAGGLGVLVSEPAGGKTTVALNLAYAVARCAQWHGRDVLTNGAVIYIAAESVMAVVIRARACRARLDIPDGEPSGIYVVPEAINFLDKSAVDRFITAARSLAPVLIIGDTFARCMVGGDENTAKDVGLVVHNTDRVIAELGCTFLWLHHLSKDGRSERGSSALRAACDFLWRLKKQ